MNSPVLYPDHPTARRPFAGRPPRRRAAVVLTIAAVVVTGCGSSPDGDSAASATDVSTTVTEAPADTSAPTDSPAASTTAEAATPEETSPTITTTPPTTMPPTTVDPLAEVRASAEAATGAYSGTWTNTTFGSTGPMAMDIALDGDDVVVDVDLGGFVFGQSDPDPESYRIPLSAIAGSEPIETVVFGPVALTVDAATGAITMSADAVPAPGIATFESTVTPTGDGTFEGTYLVTFDGGDTADGVFEYNHE